MTKQQFLDELTKSLNVIKIHDIEEIIAEYRQHFDFRLADGYSEEETCAKLGDPKTIARQYADIGDKGGRNSGKSILVASGVYLADIFVYSFFVLFAAWIIALGTLSISCFALFAALIGNFNIYSLVPSMPYICKLLMSLPALSLSALSAIGTYYCFMCLKQSHKAFIRLHRNVIASSRQKPVLPAISAYPKIQVATKRKLRMLLYISLMLFGISLVTAYIVCSLAAGSLEFWHVWKWFVG